MYNKNILHIFGSHDFAASCNLHLERKERITKARDGFEDDM